MHDFDYNELLLRYRYPVLAFLLGLILVGGGIFFFRSGFSSASKVEVLSENIGPDNQDLTVEIAGEVIRPGVYNLSSGSRIDDLLVAAGGFSESADRVWTDKYLNRAAKLTDGQKVFIPSFDSAQDKRSDGLSANGGGGYQSISPDISSDSKAPININSASLTQLDTLPGIGQVYGQSIIDHRPYSNVEELLTKGVLKKSVYEKVKDLVSTY